MKEVVDRLTVLCEKPIHLIELDEDWGSLTALKAEFEDYINVYFPPQKSLQYKLHCIYHELGHVYLETLDFALPTLSQQLLKETESAINVSCRHIEDHPVERWVEAFAFETAKKTRPHSSTDPDPFFC